MAHTDAINTSIHLLAGGVGGTVGAVITCPLDVVKTRLQSSCAHWEKLPYSGAHSHPLPLPKVSSKTPLICSVTNYSTTSAAKQTRTAPHMSLAQCLKYIYKVEGPTALYRGLGPNLVGVAPSRAIYFGAYAKSKDFLSHRMGDKKDFVHILSAAAAGFTSSTLTNPIWFLKTRLQLDEHKGSGKLTVWKCIREVYRSQGIKGFYRGLTASYMGISETALHFVIYEKLKERIIVHGRSVDVENDRTPADIAEFFLAGGMSKTIACVTFYPHEVARTRMREEGNLYRGFFQTLSKVAAEEGWQGLYKGLFTQLVRAIPNTAIMMATYELTVHLLTHNTAE